MLLRPHSGSARNNLAANLARRGKSDLAEKELKKVVELEPESYDANHNLGEFYARLGKVAAAIPHFEKAQAENPSSYDNGYDLALAYEQTGHLQEARRQIQALFRQQDTAELHNLLAEVEEQNGDFVAAVNEYEAGGAHGPERIQSIRLGLRTVGSSNARAGDCSFLRRRETLSQFRPARSGVRHGPLSEGQLR